MTTLAVLVQARGHLSLKKWPRCREYQSTRQDFIRMDWSLPRPVGCVLHRAVPCPSAGLKDRSLSGPILIILLILPQLVV
jgi:hypothetical protein